ncbi:MAG: DNA topoisomerase IB [Chloroflexota bacterium]|nr:DNA topoisomerase IB [Chloroflexota bacterium]
MADPRAAARAAGLRYVSDTGPGIRRRRVGRSFSYRRPDGQLIRDDETLRWIRSLAIPPAWTDVWISPVRNGHILATGRDARGRKQYRYHPKWREVRDEAKYGRTIAFAQALPTIRARVNEDLARRGLPREKVVATVVRLLEQTFMRVGNEEYVKANRSYGLTTLRDRHARFDGSELRFRFKGKSGKEHDVGVRDRRLARIVRQCQELPGQHLFQYIDENGERQAIDSDDVNEYLREVTGHEFTAKDFRTWAGTVLAAKALQAVEEQASPAAAKKRLVSAIEDVAKSLGNTAAICRRCYVHPTVIDSYLEGSLLTALTQRTEEELATSLNELSPEERAVMALLQRRLAADAEQAGKIA